MKTNGKLPEFRTKLEQSVDMLIMLATHFEGLSVCHAQAGMSILAVCDSWFGNNGLFAPAREKIGDAFHLLSRLRSNLTLYAMPRKGMQSSLAERASMAKGLVRPPIWLVMLVQH